MATRAPAPLPGQVVDGPRRARAGASSWCGLDITQDLSAGVRFYSELAKSKAFYSTVFG
jgi:hypothetical protein